MMIIVTFFGIFISLPVIKVQLYLWIHSVCVCYNSDNINPILKVCMRMCWCVCQRETERVGGTDRWREKQWEWEKRLHKWHWYSFEMLPGIFRSLIEIKKRGIIFLGCYKILILLPSELFLLPKNQKLNPSSIFGNQWEYETGRDELSRCNASWRFLTLFLQVLTTSGHVKLPKGTIW